MKKQIFKQGDRVFVHREGWGTYSENRNNVNWIDCDKGYRLPIGSDYISFTEYDLVNGGFSQERPEPQLEVGRSYRSKHVNRVVINRIGNDGNYGFDECGWRNNLECIDPESWQEIPESEAIALLEKECVRRYGEGWRDVKIRECMVHHTNTHTNSGRFIATVCPDVVWNKNGCIFHEGKWADPILKKGQMIWVNITSTWVHGEFKRYEGRNVRISHGLRDSVSGIWSITNPYPDSIEARAVELLRESVKFQGACSFDRYRKRRDEFLKEIDSYEK